MRGTLSSKIVVIHMNLHPNKRSDYGKEEHQHLLAMPVEVFSYQLCERSKVHQLPLIQMSQEASKSVTYRLYARDGW